MDKLASEKSKTADVSSIAPAPAALYEELEKLPEVGNLQVSISNEIVHLLSDQLYQSPLKALEELVVNSWDAEAPVCRLFVPGVDQVHTPGSNVMVIFDTGVGMTPAQLNDLWHIGSSKKRIQEGGGNTTRKQIGKFGIGKLATFTVGSQLTYVSKSREGIFSASLNFNLFAATPNASPTPVTIAIRKVQDWDALAATDSFANAIEKCKIPPKDFNAPSWTLALVESLKQKAEEITLGRLKWVLSTAMPIDSGFSLFLNGEEVKSSKESFTDLVKFDITTLPADRLKSLNSKTGDNFTVVGDAIVSNTLPLGVRGKVRVTDRTFPGKSDDLLRSHGFFVRVRGRLINEEEPFFGMVHLHHGTENRFNAQIFADDLDAVITAPREGVGRSAIKEKFEALLQEIFLYARNEYDNVVDKQSRKEANKKEIDRSFVNSNLIELPIAAALSRLSKSSGADADGTWFYTQVPSEAEIGKVIERLYTQPREGFRYQYSGSGSNGRLVSFDPATSLFTVNSDHPFAAAHFDDARARILLEDIVTAEAMLEAQLRTYGVSPQVIGEVLEERNKLLTSLVQDHPFSHSGIAQALIDASADEHDLELALVAAARALGFVAKHISGSDEPDGIARHVAIPGKTTTITLEAKSSAAVPSLSAIDFAGLARHRDDYEADGILLVAPSYPGSSKAEDAAAAKTAVSLKVSCWTIAQLATVVKAAESRHFNAQTIISIAQKAFAPDEVKAAVQDLFKIPSWNKSLLAAAIVDTLETIAPLLADMDRTVDSVAPFIAQRPEFPHITKDDIVQASSDLASSSQGALNFDGRVYTMLTSFSELRRRTTSVTNAPITPLRGSTFRADFAPAESIPEIDYKESDDN